MEKPPSVTQIARHCVRAKTAFQKATLVVGTVVRLPRRPRCLLLTVLMFGALTPKANAQEQFLPQTIGTAMPDNSALNSVHFVDATIGYAVGEHGGSGVSNLGVVLKTTDGGSTWFVAQDNMSPSYLQDIRCVDANTCYAVGQDAASVSAGGAILKTTDGGATWSTHSTGASYPLAHIHFANASVGYAVGSHYTGAGWVGFIVKTSDGGATWSSPATLVPTGLSCFFTDANTGYVAGVEDISSVPGVILKTTNGGASWSEVFRSGPGQATGALHFVDANTGFAVGGYPGPYGGQVIQKTTDGGNTWSTVLSSVNGSPPGQYLYSVRFSDPATVFVATYGGKILKATLGCGTCTPPQTCGGGGTPNVCGTPVCGGPGTTCGNGKVLVCHKGKNTLCVSDNALSAHSAHGDVCGPC